MTKPNNEARRILRFTGTDFEKDFELGKVVAVDTPKPILNLEQMPNGKYRLIYSKALLEDISGLQMIYVVREQL